MTTTIAALVIAEHDHGGLKPSTLNTIAAANLIAQPSSGLVHVLVAGHNCSEAAAAVAKVSGVSKVWVADAAALKNQLAEHVAAQVLSMAAAYSHILAPATAFGKNFLPRVAAVLDVAQVSDITAIHSADTFERPIYAGNVIATVQASDAVKVITVRTTAFDAPALTGSAEVQHIAAVPDFGKTTFVSREIAQSDRPELTAARVVVSGGRGLGSADNFKLLEALADKLNASMGASRAAVDAGYAPNDWQVGQTGKIVAPDLYIAVGISGAIQHLAGMKNSKVIVAINKDPDAPIFGVADYGLVGDLFEVLPQLTACIV